MTDFALLQGSFCHEFGFKFVEVPVNPDQKQRSVFGVRAACLRSPKKILILGRLREVCKGDRWYKQLCLGAVS